MGSLKRRQEFNILGVASVVLIVLLYLNFRYFLQSEDGRIVQDAATERDVSIPSILLDTDSFHTADMHALEEPANHVSESYVEFVQDKTEAQEAARTTTLMPGTDNEGGLADAEVTTLQVPKEASNTSIFNMDQTDPRLFDYISQHHLQAPAVLPYKNMSNVGLHPNSYSMLVQHLFHKKKLRNPRWNGTFVEAGAYDGELASNSLYLEESGWTGLLVECNPEMLPLLKLKNRKAWIADVCLSPSNTPKMMNFTSMAGWPASAKLGEPLNETEIKKHGIEWVQNKTWVNYEIPCFPLYSILKAAKIEEVDFLSLDVEGAEMDILKSFPFDKYIIRSMFVEIHTFTEAQKQDLRAFVVSQGYFVHSIHEMDDLYVLKSDPDLAN